MKPSDELKKFVLQNLANTSTRDKGAFKTLLNDLQSKYKDRKWMNDILISMDYNHDRLLNLELAQDFQGSLTGSVLTGSTNFLTPDGEFEAKKE